MRTMGFGGRLVEAAGGGLPESGDRAVNGAGRRPISILVYGLPGSGKSTFACGAPGAYVLDLGGCGSRGRGERIVSFDQLQTAYKVLATMGAGAGGEEGVPGTIVLDSLTDLYHLILDHVVESNFAGLAEPRPEYPCALDWQVAERKLRRCLAAFQGLGADLIATCLCDVGWREGGREEAEGGLCEPRFVPLLPRKLSLSIPSCFDVVCYAYAAPGGGSEGCRYLLRTGGDPAVLARDRSGRLGPVEPQDARFVLDRCREQV